MKLKHLRILQIALFILAFVCIAILFAGCDEVHTHTWDNGVVTTEATHGQTGVKTYTCSECGEIKTEAIPKVEEHTYSEWQTHNSVYHKKVCNCGETEYEEHTWDNGVVTTAAAHLQTGIMTYTCSVCGETKTETIATTTNHTYTEYQTNNSVYHKVVCDCGETEFEEHTWDSGVITTAATHTQTGVKTYTCTLCGETKTETIAKTTEHTYSDWQVCDESYHQKVCECGEIEYENHTWNNGVITNAATHTQTGIMTYTCSVCGETKTEIIAKTAEHTYSDWYAYDETYHQKVCECGQIEYEAHTFDKDTCSVCGYIDENYTPDKSYFVGNVFQVVILDLGKQVIGYGSGFVFDEEGYFITNSHVMEDAYYAYALFEIPNTAENESFTKFDITLGGYNNTDKDIFIGKIDNYSSISSYYQDINFSTEYEIGEVTYSIGYPSSPYMRVYNGYVVSNATSLNDKLNGIEYIMSTSYIASGSSGGVLINSDMEVIGITSMVSQTSSGTFVASYAISAYNFITYVNNYTSYDYTNLARFLHPDYTEYIDFFENIALNSNYNYSIDEYGIVYYTLVVNREGTNENGNAYIYPQIFIYGSDFSMMLETEIYWDNGEYRMVCLMGIWSPEKGFSDFIFLMRYEYSESDYYIILSTNINYNDNVDLTLNNYSSSSSSTYTITDNDITYSKEMFNILYEYLISVWEYYTT